MLVPLDSLTTPALEPFRNLKATNLTRWSGLFVAEGDKLVRRLAASRFPIRAIVAAADLAPRYLPLVPGEVPVYVLPRDQLERLVGFNFHHGVLAAGERVPGPSLDELAAAKEMLLRLVVCPDVQDPDNLGAILRNSAALGATGVVLGPRSADPFSRRVLRVSMGAGLLLPIVESRDLAVDLDRLGQLGVRRIATVLDPDATPLARASRPHRAALLLGSEGHGLERRWIEACDERWTIPMPTGVDSLNVAAASAVFLYRLRG